MISVASHVSTTCNATYLVANVKEMESGDKADYSSRCATKSI